MKQPVLARQIEAIVGNSHVITDSASREAYAVGGVVPSQVVAPGCVIELSHVLAAAHAAGASVVPWGGGTQQAQGHYPTEIDLVVRTNHLSGVLEYEPADLTISVEAGITMAALDALLREHGQMLPVDVPLPSQATLGGVLATATDGPRRLLYGTLRDLMIGISVVEATGRVSKAGGMVVKNVSGFDMMKLYLGSLGSLAVIASANFKLIPRPRAAATIWCCFPNTAAAFSLANAIHSSQLNPAAVEYVGNFGFGSLDFGLKPIQNPNYQIQQNVFVLAEGLAPAVMRHVRDVSWLAEQAGALDVQVLEGEEHTAVWARIADLPQTAELDPNELVLRLACLPSQLAHALSAVADSAAYAGLSLLTDARALSGVAYLRVRGTSPEALLDYYQALVAALVRGAPTAQLAVLACEPGLKEQLPVWGTLPEGLDVMRRIKSEFDPQGMLNPGRFVVG